MSMIEATEAEPRVRGRTVLVETTLVAREDWFEVYSSSS
jgi:hypothetical protein